MNTIFEKKNYVNISEKEWLVTNGIGGYASSSICFTNTRQYHGLLVAALNPPVGRKVFISKIEDFVHTKAGEKIALTTIQHPGALAPNGFENLDKFTRTDYPKATFKKDEIEIEKSVLMVPNKNTTLVTYQNNSAEDVVLELNPLFVDRDFHSTFRKNDETDYSFKQKKDILSVKSGKNQTKVFLNIGKADFIEDRYWYKGIEYIEELRRDQNPIEDAYHLGYIQVKLKAGDTYHLAMGLEKEVVELSSKKLKVSYFNHQDSIVSDKVKNPFYRDLLKSGEQFIVNRKSTDSYSILAGYHWFSDWGRDTMIAMRGLCVAMKRQDVSKSILNTFLAYLDQGMLPNRFPDQGEEPEYNTVDATLWLFVVLYEYHKKFKDDDFIKEIFPKLTDIIEHHIKGTRYNIHLTEEGFIWAGDHTTQLTWMDARIGDHTVTPRNGCPVEINALWYNALCVYEKFSKKILDEKSPYKSLSDKIENNFIDAFWNDKGYLNDVVQPNQYTDESIRPNQVYAVSLPYSLLTQGQSELVLDTIKEHLLTPLGLRTLSPIDKKFRPTYAGNQWDRDTAYHQGTTWPFPMGDYFLALFKIKPHDPNTEKDFLETMSQLELHFYNDNGLHGISEVFDGLNPEAGKGCIHQAWSVSTFVHVLAKTKLLYK